MSAVRGLFGERHDPGGSHRWPLLPGVRGAAEFSPCGRYRYWLSRRWGPSDDGPFMLSVGMNPSTASPLVDDPTLRRDQALAKREGYSALVKVNICDYRATDPRALLTEDLLVCSDINYRTIRRFGAQAAKIVVCWGRVHPSLDGYARRAIEALSGRMLWCIGTTREGSPRHPLYVSGSTPLVRWEPQR
jgi:hypothetical protein